MIEYVSFEDLMGYIHVGYQGATIELMIEDLLSETDSEAEYTVYWPKDSIRVIRGSSFAVASAVLAVLRDPRTVYMGGRTADSPAELALVRRDLKNQYWASTAEVNRDTIYRKDRLLPADIRTEMPFILTEQAEEGVTYRLDLTTLPVS